MKLQKESFRPGRTEEEKRGISSSEGKTERLMDLVHDAGGDYYLSGPSAKDYIVDEVFEKAGVTSWYAWIPFLNSYKITEIAVGNGLFFLLMFIPSVGSLIWVIILGVKLAPAFGKGTGITILTIFLTPVAYLILGFGDAQYVGPQKI